MNKSRRNFLQTGAASIAVSTLGTACAKSSAPNSPAAEAGLLNLCRTLPKSIFTMEQQNGKRLITVNGIPSHVTGQFPNPNCPGSIRARKKTFAVDLNPQLASQITPLNGWLFGVSVSGAVFDPTGPFWSEVLTGDGTWEFEVMSANGRPYLGLDGNSAHIQPDGEYHYHGLPYALISQLENQNSGSRMILLGYAADGFPIYSHLTHDDPADSTSPVRPAKSSYQLFGGTRPSGAPKGFFDGTYVQDYQFVSGLGDLDECNGRFGVTPEYPGGIYHYNITAEFPFVPRFYRGTPDISFKHGSPGPFPNALPPAMLLTGR